MEEEIFSSCSDILDSLKVKLILDLVQLFKNSQIILASMHSQHFS